MSRIRNELWVGFSIFFLIFLDFEVWVKKFKVFDLRFGFLIKNCIYRATWDLKKSRTWTNFGISARFLDSGPIQLTVYTVFDEESESEV